MDAPAMVSGTKIALRPYKVGARRVEPGDRVEYAKLEADVGERMAKIMVANKTIIDLTPENYARCITRRPAGTIGKGFTGAELVKLGIIAKAPAEPAVKQVASPVPPGEAVEYRGHRILPFKQGNFTRYEAWTADGKLMRPMRFQKIDGAKAFIDDALGGPPGLLSEPEVGAEGQAAVDPAEAAEDQGDGSDVQPGTDGPDLASQD